MDYVRHRLVCMLLAALGALVLVPNTLSALELNRYFSDGMVLQRDKALKIWGTAKAGESITVKFAGQAVKATADKDGRWIATLTPVKANATPQTLGAKSAGGAITLKNIVIGDVFLFARQSSIDVSLGTTPEGKKAAGAVAANSNFRFITIKTSPSRVPLINLKKDATRGWKAVDKKAALGMSAAAFYLGRDLAKDVKVPLGIVDLDMGYHFAAAWLSKEAAEKAASQEEVMGVGDLKTELALREKDITSWDAGLIESKRGRWSKPKEGQKPNMGFAPIEKPFAPLACYNSVMHPLRGLAVKGILLQHGNDYPFVAFSQLRAKGKHTDMSQLHRANGDSYKVNKNGNRMTTCVLPVIVDDLRNSLGDASTPLAWIMPPGSDVYQYGTHNREIRELQRRTELKTKAVDLILPGAKHVPMSGQPADEALLAARCKQWVLGTFYGAKHPASGPLFDRVEFNDNGATIHFKAGTADGLSATGDGLKHFELAGGDRVFAPCKAEIDGSTIKLTSDTGVKPAYVRFGWSRKPIQGLVNSGSLPAIPFNTDSEWVYDWWPGTEPIELPAEFSTAANKWPERKYAIVSFASTGKGLHMGPTGLWCTPSGPNLYVNQITPGSPADGKAMVGDLIYAVNGTDFATGSNGANKDFANAITKAEAVKGGGTMILNLRRDDELVQVPIKMEYMGGFSATTPWNCEKSKRIIEKAEEFMRKGLRPKTGITNDGNYMYGPWHDNALFLMASGNPEMQGLVRRYIRGINDQVRSQGPERTFGGRKGWTGSYMGMFLGEYYHRTGDPSVLPHLEYLVRSSEKWTPSTWPPTEPSRYGLHPAGQMPSVMGRLLAKEAGVKVDPAKLHFDLRFLHDGRAENGFILYCGYGAFLPSQRALKKPQPIKPETKVRGSAVSMNGKLGTGAALFSLLDGYDKAVKNCSEVCVYAFNRTRSGHGGAWFNNFWTPIGAYHAGKEKYQHFMKGQQWWRELYRDHTGAAWQAHNAKEKGSLLATGFFTHRVIHHKRLRMFGAPRSAFGPNPPACLKPALIAHRGRDYALAEKLTLEVMKKGKIPAGEKPTVDHFLESVRTLKESVAYDLSYTEEAIKRGEYYLASLELPQLKMVLAPDNARLKAIAATLESTEAKAKIAALIKKAHADNARAHAARMAQRASTGRSKQEKLASIDTLVKDGMHYRLSRRKSYATFPKEQLNPWRMKVLESPSHIPDGWYKPDHNTAGWDEVTHPAIWPMAHTALMHTTFNVKDKNAYTSIHVRANVYKQRNLQVYLNGELVAKVSNMPSSINFALPPSAMKILKNGKNSLAVSTQHGKRNVHFSFRLEGRFKDGRKATQ